MSHVETTGSSEWPTFGPPSSWSIDQQLEWIIDNTTVEVSEAQEPALPLYTPGTDAEIIDDDGEDETENSVGSVEFFLSLEDPPDDSHAEEELDECPGTLRECAVAGANIRGGAEMLRLVDCIEDQTTGDHTATLLPVLTNRSPGPTTPALKRKGSCQFSPTGPHANQQSASKQKRFRITFSDSYWDQKIKRENERQEGIPAVKRVWSRVGRLSKLHGRDLWVRARLNSRSNDEKEKLYFAESRARLKTRWVHFPTEFKTAWGQYYEDKQHNSDAPAPPLNPEDLDKWDRCAQLPPNILPIANIPSAEASNPEFDPNAIVRVHGYCLTWQGTWGHRNTAVKALASRDLPLPVMVAAIKASPFYQWLWQKFKNFCLDRCDKFKWVKKSGQMEVTPRRKKPQNLVHFHLAVSDMGNKHRLRPAQDWEFLGSRPYIVPTSQRGRGMEDKINCMHYYCQAPKLGTVMVFTNYRAFVDCPVQMKTVFSLWSQYKMEDSVAMHQIRLARGRGTENCIRDVQCNTKWRLAIQAEAETVRAMALPDEAEQRHGESDRMGAHVPGALWPVDSLPVLGVDRREPHGKDQVRSQPLRFDPHPSSVMPGRVRPRFAQVQQSGTQGHCF